MMETAQLEGDVGNFRRVKPLPKRRRTAALTSALRAAAGEYDPADIASLAFQDPQAIAALAELHTGGQFFPPFPAPHLLLKELFNGEPPDPRLAADFPGIYGPASLPVVPVVPDDEDHGESDYIDHLQLPANTKKRKVPGLNRPASIAGDVAAAVTGGDGEHEGSLLLAAHRRLADGPDGAGSLAPASAVALARRNTRESHATLAALQHKEMVKTRKRQIAAVLDEFPEGDALALDRALSARYPQLDGVDPKAPPPLRNSRKANAKPLKQNPESKQAALAPNATFPSCEFTFEYPSTSGARYIATREEATRLRTKFEDELARQAARAIDAAARHTTTLEPPAKNRKRAAGASTRYNLPPASRPESESASGDQGLPGKGRQKKKKRSALANASNPHHLRNYVPSRLPQQPLPITQATLAAANFLTPPPLRFLGAQSPPRRRKKGSVPSSIPVSTLTAPIDEWICANCEYNLFYGDEYGFKRAVKSRKKILSRRRRARERAAAAASGNTTIPEKRLPPIDDYSETETTKALPAPASVPPGKRERDQHSGLDPPDTLK